MLSITVKVLVTVFGMAALLVAGVALMPARTIKLATDRIDGLTLGGTEGRLYRGQANVAYRGRDLGLLTWSVLPGTLLTMRLGAGWQVAHPDYTVSGTAAVGGDSTEFVVTGIIDALAVNRFLSQYHISLEGMFEVDEVDVRLDEAGIAADGRVRWSGGRALYRLSGETHDVELPEMVGTLASIEGRPALEVVAATDSGRLLGIRLDAEGWAHIDVTARLTSLAGTPWHDGEGDDAVVVTVSERLFAPGILDVPDSGA